MSDQKNSEPHARSDRRDIWNIITAIAMPAALALIGIIASNSLEKWKESESSDQLYTQLMNQREESNNSLRKDMFASMIQPFVQTCNNSTVQDPQAKVLNLELLVQNFHESFELGPLFKDLMRQLSNATDKSHQDLRIRLELAAKDVRLKQLSVVEEAGNSWQFPPIDFPPLRDGESFNCELDFNGIARNYDITVFPAMDPSNEFRINVVIATLRRDDGKPLTEFEKKLINVSFDLSQFDFPMIRNTRLSADQRCAIVLRDISRKDKQAVLELVCFPGSCASIQDRPYIDEVIDRMRANRK
jgi:hypothetical protein